MRLITKALPPNAVRSGVIRMIGASLGSILAAYCGYFALSFRRGTLLMPTHRKQLRLPVVRKNSVRRYAGVFSRRPHDAALSSAASAAAWLNRTSRGCKIRTCDCSSTCFLCQCQCRC